MNKKVRKIMIMFFALFLVFAISGCTDNKEASNTEKSEGAEAKDKSQAAQKDTKNSETANADIQDFVLENTKMVKIFNISQRIHQKHPDLGPFQVVRGIDERGQKSEIWIKDMKIYEMISSESNQTSANNSGEKEENTAPEAK